MNNVIFFACCIVLVIVPSIFIRNKVYKDGIFGRASLGGMVVSCSLLLWDCFWKGTEYDIPWAITILVLWFTVFLCWHLIRFHTRVARRAMMGERKEDQQKDPSHFHLRV